MMIRTTTEGNKFSLFTNEHVLVVEYFAVSLSPLISFKYDEEPKSNITVFTFALSLSAIDDDDE